MKIGNENNLVLQQPEQILPETISLATQEPAVPEPSKTTQFAVPKNVSSTPLVVRKIKRSSITKKLEATSPDKLIQLPESVVTFPYPLKNCRHHPDAFRPNSLLEKSLLKYNLLPPVKEEPSEKFFLEWPKISDRVGIYYDPHLIVYHSVLLKSLPPIRIFLCIEEDEPISSEESMTNKSPALFFYSAKSRRNRTNNMANHHSSPSNRLAVKTLCRVNGKLVKLHTI